MAPRSKLPFWVKRPLFLLRDLAANRNRPDLAGLGQIQDPETFVWRILPHAARTFAACILLLPREVARGAAVAYLYCRMLDCYEDLLPGLAAKEAALSHFAQRFSQEALPKGPPLALDPALAADQRDACHILLVNRANLVDQHFQTLRKPARQIIKDLIEEMAGGMCWAARTFTEQGGCLKDEAQLARYCYGVLGCTIAFSLKLFRYHTGTSTRLDATERELVAASGEFIQLANITRDIEKDLLRGLAYHPLLAGHLGHESAGDPHLLEIVRQVRGDLLQRALSKAPAYARLVEHLPGGRLSLFRASGVLMMLHTERYYQRCGQRCGRRVERPRRGGLALLLKAFPAWWSQARAQETLTRSVKLLLELGRSPETRISAAEP